MIRDQRHIYDLPLFDESGHRLAVTPEDIEAHWRHFADASMSHHGFMFSQRRDAKSFRKSRRQLVAYLNHSRWCADCPMDDCNGGIALWRENEQACCLDCGTIFTKIKWSDENDLNRVLVAALQHPDEAQRNWHPERQTPDEAIERMRFS